MKRLSNPELGLILLFLVIVGGVPLSQVVVEACRGERPQVLQIFQRKPTAKNLRAYESNLEDSSWVAARLRPWAQYAQFAWLNDGGEKALVGRDGWLFYKPGVEYTTERPGIRHSSTTTADALSAIVDFRDQLAARGIRLLVMLSPDKESVYPEKLTRRGRGMEMALSSETRELLSRLKAADVEVVDLFKLFGAAKVAGTSNSPALYLARDSHWSPSGVELAAQAVARRILERNWMELGSVFYAVKASPVNRIGDILRMLQVPQLETEATAEIAPCRQVSRADSGEPYKDDVHSKVLVLGDSFLRIYQTDEPGAAGFIAQLARELRQPVASIVNDGGASTLVRQELSRRPTWLTNKKVVIWQFVERDIRLGLEGWQHVALPSATAATAENTSRHLTSSSL
jgi:hypothetical protein